MAASLTFEQIDRRLCHLRQRRRRIGLFDWCRWSYDRRTTAMRALRIWLRLNGRREPLQHFDEPDRTVRWNAYHH